LRALLYGSGFKNVGYDGQNVMMRFGGDTIESDG